MAKITNMKDFFSPVKEKTNAPIKNIFDDGRLEHEQKILNNQVVKQSAIPNGKVKTVEQFRKVASDKGLVNPLGNLSGGAMTFNAAKKDIHTNITPYSTQLD